MKKVFSNDDFKKITLEFFDDSYKQEINSFLSIRVNLQEHKSYLNLTSKEIFDILTPIYFGLLSNLEKESEKIIKEKLKKIYSGHYKLQKNDIKLLADLYPYYSDNLLLGKSPENLKDFSYISINDARICKTGENFLGFLNCNLNKFDGFFRFFTTFICEFIDKIPQKYKKLFSNSFLDTIQYEDNKITKVDFDKGINTPSIDLSVLKECAKIIYKEEQPHVKQMQKFFREFVNYIYNINNLEKLSSLSVKQRFWVYSNICPTVNEISSNFSSNYELNYMLSSVDFINHFFEKIEDEPKTSPLKSENFLIDSIKKCDPDNKNIRGMHCTFETNSIYTYFYLVLYIFTLSNSGYIKQCKYCKKYFYTDKKNVLFCDNIQKNGQTCKEINSIYSQTFKQQNNSVYAKYRKIFSKKAMLVKRNPDILSYKENYEKWKLEAKKFMKDIKNEVRTYEEFDKWLDENH